MVKKLTQLGNSLGILIDKPILDLLKITRDTPLEVSTDGERLILTPQKVAGPKEARRVGQRVMAKHAEVLRKLAK